MISAAITCYTLCSTEVLGKVKSVHLLGGNNTSKVFLKSANLDHVSAHWQIFTICLKEGIRTFPGFEKKRFNFQQRAKTLFFWVFDYAIIHEFLVSYSFPLTVNCLWLLVFVNIPVLLFTRIIKVTCYSYQFHIAFH